MRQRAARLLLHAALVALAAAALLPLLWMVAVSFMPAGTASVSPPPLLPHHPTTANYRLLFASQGMGRYFANSLCLALLCTACSLLCNSLAGFAFAKLRFAGSEALLRVLLAALVIPSQVAMMPLFLMMKWLGFVNTYAGVVLPAAASIFGVFLVRQYALSIPDELLEAARIDGAGEGRIFLRIVLPVLRPILVTLAIFTFLASWNDFLWPLIAIQSEPHMTLQLGLSTFQGAHATNWTLLMAGNVMATLPMLVAFVVAQKQFVNSIASAGVKG